MQTFHLAFYTTSSTLRLPYSQEKANAIANYSWYLLKTKQLKAQTSRQIVQRLIINEPLFPSRCTRRSRQMRLVLEDDVQGVNDTWDETVEADLSVCSSHTWRRGACVGASERSEVRWRTQGLWGGCWSRHQHRIRARGRHLEVGGWWRRWSIENSKC